MLTGVIFDYSVLFNEKNNVAQISEIRDLLNNLCKAGIQIAVFSTNDFHLGTELKNHGYPQVDLFLTKSAVKKNKGNKEWVYKVCETWGCKPHNLLYVADDRSHFLAAHHSGTLFINAEWIHSHTDKPKYPAFAANDAATIWRFITHYLLTQPRWEFSIDGEKTTVRSLLNAQIKLPANGPDFSLQSILTYANKNIKVGNKSAHQILMNHVITSLYLEGFIEPYSVFCLYPSSTPNKNNPVLDDFVQPASRVFHGYERDILERKIQALDSSLERVAKRTVEFTNQTNTVCLNSIRKNMIEGKNVIVFDDFTTTGMSLDWARQLLVRANARRIILMTVGKYPKSGNNFRVYSLPEANFSPYEIQMYGHKELSYKDKPFKRNPNAPDIIRASFEYIKKSEPLPSTFWAHKLD